METDRSPVPRPEPACTRVEVASTGGWSLWVLPRNSFGHQLQVVSGRLRLLLLHDDSGVRLHTRCRASDWKIDLDDGNQSHRLDGWDAVKRTLGERIPLPCLTWVREHEAYWVHLPQLGVTRRLLLCATGPD